MSRQARRLLTIVGLAMLVAPIAMQAVAGADTYPPVVTFPPVGTFPPFGTGQGTPLTIPTPPGQLTTSTTQVGGQVTVSGTNCGANQQVGVSFNGTPAATATTDASGRFTSTFPVPPSAGPGVYAVTASNSLCVLSGTVEVDPASASRLAFTGSSNTIPTLWVGVGLLALGGALVFVARRRLSGAH